MIICLWEMNSRMSYNKINLLLGINRHLRILGKLMWSQLRDLIIIHRIIKHKKLLKIQILILLVVQQNNQNLVHHKENQDKRILLNWFCKVQKL